MEGLTAWPAFVCSRVEPAFLCRGSSLNSAFGFSHLGKTPASEIVTATGHGRELPSIFRSQGSTSSTTICASGRASGATLSPAACLVTLR